MNRELYEGFYYPHLTIQSQHTRNSRFNLPPVRLNFERNFIFQSKNGYIVAPAQPCVPMFDYVFKRNHEKVVLESYER